MSVVRSPYFTRSSSSSSKQPKRRPIKDHSSSSDKENPKQSKVSTANVKREARKGAIPKDRKRSLQTQQNETPPQIPQLIKIKREYAAEESPSNVKEKWEPNNWEQQLFNIRKMREAMDAPVDTMGCEKCKGDNYSEKDKRFHILISLMLSSQTKDQITHSAMLRLIGYGLTADTVLEMSDKQLGEMIYPVGFWKKKIVYLKKTAEILKKNYDGDIPCTIDGLVKLPGVGPKMAYLAMTCAWNKVVGIGVDVHVHRIANRLKWVRKPTTDPEKTRKELEDWLPQSYWREVNWLLVGFGQQICLPVSPRCTDCLNKDICPASAAKTRKKMSS